MVTPQEIQKNLAQTLGITELYFKREDLHPFGSHKGRSMPFMIENKMKTGARHFAVSSSGNAALAALLYVKTYNSKYESEPIDLEIFVGNKINPDKLGRLTDAIHNSKHITVTKTERPIQAVHESVKKGKTSLRQSMDDNALSGYGQLAEELSIIPNLKAIFIPTSSGTAAQKLSEILGDSVQIHIVQTTACHPIAGEFDTDVISELSDSPSIADAIVDKIVHRKEAVKKGIQKSHGWGWIVNNADIEDAIKLVEQKSNILLSPNSALAIAGLIKAKARGWNWDGAVCCIITGK